VCVGFFQLKRRMRRFWKTKATPILRGVYQNGSFRDQRYKEAIPSIETSKIIRHSWQTEIRSINILPGPLVDGASIWFNIFRRYNLLK